MSAGIEYGWQTTKTVLECNRYMLDNEIETDVCFEFPSEDGNAVCIQAHRYMLISRSPVLWTMHHGEFPKRARKDTKIIVDDIHPDVFKEMLRSVTMYYAIVLRRSLRRSLFKHSYFIN